MTTQTKQDDITKTDPSNLLLMTLHYSMNELITNPSRFTNPQELLADLLVKHHAMLATLVQFLLLERIYDNFDQFTKPRLQLEIHEAAKTVEKLISEWLNLLEATIMQQPEPTAAR